MPYEQRTIRKKLENGNQFMTYYYAHNWARSPRVNGRLILQANDWSLTVLSRGGSGFREQDKYPALSPPVNVSPAEPKIQRARAIAESDLRGALSRSIKDKVSSSFGVAAASAGQSIAMLKKSASTLTSLFSAVERFYRTARGKKRLKRFRRMVDRNATITAGLVLEGFFGWVPLFEDFFNAAKTLSNPWPKTWTSVKKRYNCNGKNTTNYAGTYTNTQWSATGHSSYATEVIVTNPQLWLGNKLGLINPFAVAWDLVPWSFLVNMVSNMGQIMGSLSDFAGVNLRNSSLTTKLEIKASGFANHTEGRRAVSTAVGTSYDKYRTRAVGAPVPNVTPYIRFPEWGVGTAAILGALLVQNTFKISKAIGHA